MKILLLASLSLICLFFGLQGISTNHSFWADESYISQFSRDIATGKVGIWQGASSMPYQRLQIITEAISFKLFGVSEWSARFPSVLWGSIGVIFAYLLATKLSNRWGGTLAGFIYTFFQLNLAYFTQAKPYAAIETIFIIVIYLCIFLGMDIKNFYFHLTILFLCFVATLYNFIGAFVFLPYVTITLLSFTKNKKTFFKFFLFFVILVAALVWQLKIYLYLPLLLHPAFNWTTLLRELFWRQYAFIALPAIFGLFMIEDRKLKTGILFSVLSLIYAWNFVQYSHNVRYLLPIFGLFIILFGIFWARVGGLIFKNSLMTCLAVAIFIYAGGYKIVRKPSTYYTPNADFTADVQNADFKTFFKDAYQLHPDFDSIPTFVGPADTLSWYTDRYPTALFAIHTTKPEYVKDAKAWQYGSLDEFKTQQAKYNKGLVIVNDWQSFMPDDIKDYVKKNMKLELRVESMAVSPEDKWPLELYSWGMK